ncbi:MAG: ParM/StbA family protein [Ktedonobacteraceae bacterium]|nr:ParM/StbA family protein [Ktedonobacteraceae bacterium]
MKLRTIPTYYGGFDPGTGRAGLTLVSADGVSLENDTMTIDSIVATGSAEKLLKRGDIHATVAEVLREDECLITFNSTDYFLCDLVKEGKNPTNAVADPARYWGDHARVLLLALACTLIPERTFVLRLVTALPVTLYDRDNRKRMKEALSDYYRFEYNGRIREVYVSVGYVAMEGQGALIHCGAQDGEQALLDIGERTVDVIAADGQKLMISLCGGNEELGIGQITDAVKTLAQRYGRQLPAPHIHDILWAWARNETLPVVRTSQGTIPENEIASTIEKARITLAKGMVSFASSLWNVEGEAVGERFDQIYIAGGGAHYVGDLLKKMFPRVEIPVDPEDANIRGYLDLACSLEDKVPGIWEVD